MTEAQGAPSRPTKVSSLRRLRLSIVAIIIILTIQGWTGDFTNLFVSFSTSSVAFSMGGLLTALYDSGLLALYHGIEGALLVVLSIIILALSFSSSKARSIRLTSFLATAAIVSATVGGVLFVLSDFQNNANSAQMGGSFIGPMRSTS